MFIKTKSVETVKQIYVAKDGREFKSKSKCECYEKFCPKTVYDVIKDYVSFTDENTIIDFKNNVLEEHTYLIINKEIPCDIIDYCKIVFDNSYWFFPYAACTGIYKPTLFYFSYTSDGCSKWYDEGSYESLLKEKEKIENKIKKFENKVDI